jgi:hypothetical protein
MNMRRTEEAAMAGTASSTSKRTSNGPRAVAGAIVLLGMTAAGAARADFVDFTSAVFGADSWSTTIDGITITATAGVGAQLAGDSFVGLTGYQSDLVDASGSSFTGQGLQITFSAPVNIISADLVDAYRFTSNFCLAPSCAATGDPSDALVAVSASGPAVVAVGTAGPTVPGGNTDYSLGYTESNVSAGFYATGDLAGSSFTQSIGETSSVLNFSPIFVGSALAAGVDLAQTLTIFGIRGLTFSADSSTRVPELNASALTSALALLLGAFMLAAERRRRRQRA